MDVLKYAAEKIKLAEEKKQMSEVSSLLPDSVPDDFDSTFEEDAEHEGACDICGNAGFLLKESEFFVRAALCQCQKSFYSKQTEELVVAISSAQIPNLYLKAAATCDETDIDENQLVFFSGGVGTGKTHQAIQCMVKALKAGTAKDGIYIPLYDFLEKKRASSAIGFDCKDEKNEAEIILGRYRKALLQKDFVIIDELGQEKLTPSEEKTLFGILDKRYSSGKPTLVISNHGKEKSKSLHGKLIKDLVGERIASRLETAKFVYFGGPDRRKKENKIVEVEVITKEEAEEFNMGEASPKLMTLDDNTHQIMTWLTRNPAFETISVSRRKELTEVIDSQERDKNREKPNVYRDVWNRDSTLIVDGPVCDQEDMKLYAVLIKELVHSHKFGNRGLSIELSFCHIFRCSGLREGGSALLVVKRRLDRLNRMNLTFTNAKGNRWSGPLIMAIGFTGDGRERKVKLYFNPYMIAFYKAHEYTMLNKDLFWALNGDSATLFAFYTSHESPELKVSIEQLQKILAIPETTPKKAVVRRVTTAFKKLTEVGLFDPKKSRLEKNVAHSFRAAAFQ